jgi:flagellar FliL protein
MLRILLPLVLVLAGLGGGVAAGLALRPAPAPVEAATADCAEGEDCPEASVAPAPVRAGPSEYVPLDKPFVVPVFNRERVSAMVVVSLSVDVAEGHTERLAALQPRLRDGLLAVMFRHANSGGFDGSFTDGERMADLKAGLLRAAREVLGPVPVHEVLVTDIVRQDV